MPIDHICCAIGCSAPATFTVMPEGTDTTFSDDPVEACPDHLGHLLTDARKHIVISGVGAAIEG